MTRSFVCVVEVQVSYVFRLDGSKVEQSPTLYNFFSSNMKKSKKVSWKSYIVVICYIWSYKCWKLWQWPIVNWSHEGPLGGGKFRAGSIRFAKSQWWFLCYGSFGPKPILNANAQPKDTKLHSFSKQNKKRYELLVEAITGLLKVTSFTLKPKNFLNNFDYI